MSSSSTLQAATPAFTSVESILFPGTMLRLIIALAIRGNNILVWATSCSVMPSGGISLEEQFSKNSRQSAVQAYSTDLHLSQSIRRRKKSIALLSNWASQFWHSLPPATNKTQSRGAISGGQAGAHSLKQRTALHRFPVAGFFSRVVHMVRQVKIKLIRARRDKNPKIYPCASVDF
jgi:hypothetical protein